MYYPTKSLYIWECFQSILSMHCVSNPSTFIFFCGVPITSVVFPRGWKSKVEILFMLTSWVYLYFPLLLGFLCIAFCQQQCFPQWIDARKNNYIKFTTMSTEIYYIYKFTRLIIYQIVSVLLWGILETVLYHSRFLILFIDFLTFCVIGLWLHFFFLLS